MTMRVYEFSKQCGVSSKELLKMLHDKGFDVSSHMSILSPDQINFLNKQCNLAPQNENKSPAKKQDDLAVPKETTSKPVEEKVSIKKPAESLERKVYTEKTPSLEINHQPELPKKTHIAPFVVQPMLVAQAAQALGQPVTSVIITLLKWGVVATKNQLLTEDIVTRLASHYEVDVIKPEKKEKSETKAALASSSQGESQERPPVVVVVGHVDHGKTTLLDFIRKTRVAAREKGGITQHLGAYEANTPQGNVVFIDTPGHEAFSKMRMRGVRVADVVVLVVAADDGVMPQTVEAIKHAKAMGVPIIVAINKVDKVEPARIEQVKQELSRYDLLAEEWGGSVIVVPISAKTGVGIDQLLEMIILQSQVMELRADVSGPARGYVLEAKLEKGRGPVATILTQHGMLHVGDFFASGTTTGRISSLIDSHGARVQSVGPSIPVRVAGFSALPEAGDYFEVVSREQYLKAKSTGIIATNIPARTLAKENAINILIKTDTNSSKEALIGSIQKLSKKFEKQFNVINASIGDVSESDISLADTTGSIILTLHTKVGPNAQSLAQKQEVTIEQFDIIYKLLERLEAIAEGAKEIKMVREKTGEAVVRRVFDIKGLGVIAGCYVTDGRFTKDGNVIIWRGKQKIGQGKIKSLQRDKKVVKEVHAGYECAFIIDGVTDWAVDDRVECFIEVPEKQK